MIIDLLYQLKFLLVVIALVVIKDKVRDNCHITRKFRGAAHKECNSKLRIPRKLPVIFHNLEGHGGHLIFRELNNFKNIDERYMSIIVNRNIIFLDSLQFLKASLDTLVGNLQDRDFNNLMSEFPSDRLDLLRTKNAYPYEWVDSYQRFTYPRLPPKIYIHLFIQVFIHLLIMEKRGKDDGYISYAHY